MNIRVKKLCQSAVLPTYGTEYAAGADLYALQGEDIVIPPHESVKLHTGLSFEIPEGYAGFVYARSGLATKSGLAPANKVGVIDADYRGEVMVVLYNHSSEARTVKGGERVAQIVIAPVIHASFEEADSLSDTVRADGGFGSTGRI